MGGIFGGGDKGAAEEARRQADQQRAQFEQEQTNIRESNYLKSQQAMDSVTRVESGGSAAAMDQNSSTLTTKKKKNAGVSSSLGI